MSGVCPLGASAGTEVDVSPCGSTQGLVAFRGSESLGGASICDSDVRSSNVGGAEGSSVCVQGSAGGWGSGLSSDSAGAGLGATGGRDFLRLSSLRTSMMVFLSSLSLLVRDGLCFMAVLRSNFSSSSVSCSSRGVS